MCILSISVVSANCSDLLPSCVSNCFTLLWQEMFYLHKWLILYFFLFFSRRNPRRGGSRHTATGGLGPRIQNGFPEPTVLFEMEQFWQQPGHGFRQPLQVREPHRRNSFLWWWVYKNQAFLNLWYNLNGTPAACSRQGLDQPRVQTTFLSAASALTLT